MAYTTEKFFADIDAKTYINEFRRTDYFIEFCQQCKNYPHQHYLSCAESFRSEKVRSKRIAILGIVN